MYIDSLQLADFRNYEKLDIHFSKGTNILYGDNAQGKTNILESLYMTATTRSHKSVRDKDMIRFGCSEAHIRTVVIKGGIDYRIDMHLRSGKSKGIAINGQRIKRASQLIGLVHIVFFAPEDLSIVKNGPASRRRFMDMELCQLDMSFQPSLESTLPLWDEQLVTFGTKIIERREAFMRELADIIGKIHEGLSGGREKLCLSYEPDVTADAFSERLKNARTADKYQRATTVGPHKDDFSFVCNGIDIRRFGSQGQQRTCALSLKLSEIDLVKQLIGEPPVLMLDDVLSELDSGRQNYLLNSLGGFQTFITCTGLDEFVSNRFAIDRLYQVVNGTVTQSN